MSTKVESMHAGSNRKIRGSLIALFIVLILLVGGVTGATILANRSVGELLTSDLSVPLEGATTAKVAIEPVDGNLTVDSLTGGEALVAGGTLQFRENQGQPEQTVVTFQNHADLTLKGKSSQPWLNLPWAACNGATDWLIHLNPKVVTKLTATSGGGNISLNLAGTAVTSLSAETGGGNVNVTLPEGAANLNASFKSGGGDVSVKVGSGTSGSSTIQAGTGAGNVAITLPDGIEARVHVTTGMGKVMVDERFTKIDDATYQTAGYESATDKVEITASSGAGNVTIN